MPQFIAGLILLVGVAVAASDMADAYKIEKSLSAVNQADAILRDARRSASEQLADAKRRNDAVAEARAQALLKSLELIYRRSNPNTVARQVEENKQAFSEKNQREFWPSLITNSAQWMPGAKIKELLALAGGVQDIATAGGGSKPITAQEMLEQTKIAVGSLDRYGPLPPEIGDYLAASILDKVRKENPQIATLSQAEQMGFSCGQARKRIANLLLNERDDSRRNILESAQKTVEVVCAEKIDLTGKWDGTMTVTDTKVCGVQGCEKAILEQSGKPQPLTLDFTPQSASAGTAVLVVTDEKGKKTTTSPLAYTFDGERVVIDGVDRGDKIKFDGKAAAGQSDYALSGTFSGEDSFGLDESGRSVILQLSDTFKVSKPKS